MSSLFTRFCTYYFNDSDSDESFDIEADSPDPTRESLLEFFQNVQDNRTRITHQSISNLLTFLYGLPTTDTKHPVPNTNYREIA